jgi:hypothetical protein
VAFVGRFISLAKLEGVARVFVMSWTGTVDGDGDGDGGRGRECGVDVRRRVESGVKWSEVEWSGGRCRVRVTAAVTQCGGSLEKSVVVVVVFEWW